MVIPNSQEFVILLGASEQLLADPRAIRKLLRERLLYLYGVWCAQSMPHIHPDTGLTPDLLTREPG